MTDRVNVDALRSRLEGTRGREYWRSLESLTETPEFKEFLHREFPQNASEWLDPVGRRNFLKLMGASLALAGVSACTRQPNEELVPYVRQPEELVPGKPLFYATAMPMNGAGIGLLVESHEGRPTKIEGNPDHPSSRGATDVFAQAAILGLYDPDRSQTLTNLGEIRPFTTFASSGQGALGSQKASQGAGIRILSETVASPTLAAQITALIAQYPRAKWVQWEPAGRHNAREGSRAAFGEYVDAQYAVDKATVIVSLDADFLCTGAAGIRNARAFASRRRVDADRSQANRLYAVESSPTNTGSRADHHLALRATEIEAFTRALAVQPAPLRRPRQTGSHRLPAICKRIAARVSSLPATGSRQSCTRWPTRSMTSLATSAQPSRTPRQPKRSQSTRRRLCASWSARCMRARWNSC
jgi:molybdopterin-containing oxidoreductase family iron-sulfur binding subunit